MRSTTRTEESEKRRRTVRPWTTSTSVTSTIPHSDLRLLPATKPPVEVASMNDTEHKNDPFLFDHVVHHTVIPDPEPMKRVRTPTDGLHALPTDPTALRGLGREALECVPDPRPSRCGKLSKRSHCCW